METSNLTEMSVTQVALTYVADIWSIRVCFVEERNRRFQIEWILRSWHVSTLSFSSFKMEFKSCVIE
jgi:hypothetical protein